MPREQELEPEPVQPGQRLVVLLLLLLVVAVAAPLEAAVAAAAAAAVVEPVAGASAAAAASEAVPVQLAFPADSASASLEEVAGSSSGRHRWVAVAFGPPASCSCRVGPSVAVGVERWGYFPGVEAFLGAYKVGVRAGVRRAVVRRRPFGVAFRVVEGARSGEEFPLEEFAGSRSPGSERGNLGVLGLEPVGT